MIASVLATLASDVHNHPDLSVFLLLLAVIHFSLAALLSRDRAGLTHPLIAVGLALFAAGVAVS